MCFFAQERSNIEKEYAKQLKQWSNKWESIIQKGDFSKYHPKGSFFKFQSIIQKGGETFESIEKVEAWKA